MLAPRRQEDRDREAERHHDPDGVDVRQVEGLLYGAGDDVEDRRHRGADHAVHGGLLHREVHREEAIAHDRGAEHQREHHVRGNAHRIDLIGGGQPLGHDEPRVVDERAGKTDEDTEHDQRSAVAAERRVDAPVGLHQVAQAIDHEEEEREDPRHVQRARGGRPAPVRPHDALHEQR